MGNVWNIIGVIVLTLLLIWIFWWIVKKIIMLYYVYKLTKENMETHHKAKEVIDRQLEGRDPR